MYDKGQGWTSGAFGSLSEVMPVLLRFSPAFVGFDIAFAITKQLRASGNY